MRGKSILALAVALAMIFSVIPSFGLTASAAAEEKTLFDATTISGVTYNNGDADLSNFGWTKSGTGSVNFNTRWEKGEWKTQDTAEAPALMFFRAGKRQDDPDEFPVATINNAEDTFSAGKIVISFDYAAQVENDNYQTWEFTDLDDKVFARVFSDIGTGTTSGNQNSEMQFGYVDGEETPAYSYIARATDSRDKVIAMRGKHITITAEDKGKDGYTVSYTVDNAEAPAYTQKVASGINGFKSVKGSVAKWNNQFAAMGMQNLKITYVPCETIVEVKATYKIGDEVVATEAGKYDSAKSKGVDFPEKNVIYNGEAYHAAAQTLSASKDITMEKVERYTSKALNEEFTVGDKVVIAKGESVVVNGNFAAGTAGWINRTPNTEVTGMTVAYDDSIEAYAMQGGTAGADATNSIGTEWKVEVGKLYYATLMVKTTGITESNYKFNRLVNTPKTEDFNGKPTLPEDIITFGKDVRKDNQWQKFEAIFTPTNDTVTLVSSWAGDISFANIEIFPIEYKIVDVTGTYTIDGEPHGEPATGSYNPNEGETGVTFPEKYEYYNDKVYKYPETTLDKSGNIEAVEYTYKSQTDGEDFYVGADAGGENEPGDKMYTYNEEKKQSLVVNGDLITGSAEPWLNRDGTKFTGSVTDEEIDGVPVKALNLHNGGASDTATIGQIWELEPEETYYIAFDIKGLAKSDNNMYASLASATDVANARSLIKGNISKDEDDILKDKWTESEDWQKYEAIYKATAEKPFIFLSFSWMNAKLTNVEIVKVKATDAEKLEKTTVTVKDAEGNELGTYEPEDKFYAGQTVTVPAGVYKGTDGHWYLDKDAESTAVTAEGKAEVTANALTAFTWRKKNKDGDNQLVTGKKMGDDANQTYNAATVVQWGSDTKANRAGYVLTTAPETFVPEAQNMVMNVTLYYGNGTGAGQVPKAVFSLIDAAALKAIDLTKGQETTDALEKLTANELMTVDLRNYASEKQGTISIPLDEAAIALITAEEVAGKEVAVMIHDDGETEGIVFVYDVQFETVSKEVEVTYVDENGETLGTEKLMPNEDGTLPIKGRTFVANGKFYTVEENLTADATKTEITATVDPDKMAAKSFATTAGSETAWLEYVVAVGNGSNIYDDDNNALATGRFSGYGSARTVTEVFDLPTLEEGDVAILHLAVGSVRKNNGGPENGVFRAQLSANGATAYTTEVVDDANDGGKTIKDYITADVTALVKAATAAEASELSVDVNSAGAIGLVSVDQSGFDGSDPGLGSYIEVVKGVKITVEGAGEGALITKNGAKMDGTEFYATENDVIRVYNGADYTTGLATIVGEEGDSNEFTVGQEAATIEVTPTLGVELLDGAQVRIGASENGEIVADSGLRFIGVVNKNGTLAGKEGAKISVEITAKQGSDLVVDIPIELYQDEESTIFTAVLTNIKPSNYNRMFVATPVVTIGEDTYKGTGVTRSIYEVAAGILVTGGVDEDAAVADKEYAMDDTVKAVLNAYVNTVGVRFGWTSETENGLPVAENGNAKHYYAFGNEDTTKQKIFFNVSSVDNQDGTYTITLEPEGENVVIDTDMLLQTIKINNNNSKVAKAISDIKTDEKGVVTFKFNPTAAQNAE